MSESGVGASMETPGVHVRKKMRRDRADHAHIKKSSSNSSTVAEQYSDSPLDFSTKNNSYNGSKNKRNSSSNNYHSYLNLSPEQLIKQEGEIQDSAHLRNMLMLNMKPNLGSESLSGSCLNLSKMSPNASPSFGIGNGRNGSHSLLASPTHSHHSGCSSSYGSSSPIMESPQQQLIQLQQQHLRNYILSSQSAGNGVIPSEAAMSHGPAFLPNFAPVAAASALTSPPQALSVSTTTSPNMGHHMGFSVLTSPNPGLSVNPGGEGASKGKMTRPFKAYPKDPMSFASMGLYGFHLGAPPSTAASMLLEESARDFAEYRAQYLLQNPSGKAKRSGPRNGSQSGGSGSGNSGRNDPLNYEQGDQGSDDNLCAPEDGSSQGCPSNKTDGPVNTRDQAYWDRRRKNNEAAKRSRDARRAKEDEIAIRASFLERENIKLRMDLFTLKTETQKLRLMLYTPPE